MSSIRAENTRNKIPNEYAVELSHIKEIKQKKYKQYTTFT
jgi:hypothetical protein